LSTATKKVPKENAAPYNLPKKRASLSFQLCQRVGLTRNPARRPRFAVHGKSPLPKLKSDAGCKGKGKAKSKTLAERQKGRADPVFYEKRKRDSS